MIEKKTFRVVLEFVEDLLGTVPKNKKVYETYIAGKAAEAHEKEIKRGIPAASGEPLTTEASAALLEEELETVQEIEERGWTGFQTDEEGPFLYNYALKGFFKEAASTLQKQPDQVKQLKDRVTRFLFVTPRRIRLATSAEGQPDALERPLRAMTAQGPRVSLSKSDRASAGTRVTFTLELLAGSSITLAILKDLLAYGQYIGLGQWRSGGYGQFEVVEIEEV